LFTDKNDAWCEECGRPLLLEIGVESPKNYNAFLEELTDRLITEGHFEARKQGAVTSFSLDHPSFFEERMYVVLGDADLSIKKIREDKRAIVATVVASYVGNLIADIELANHWHSPLGSIIKFHEQLLRPKARETTEAEVAFHLELPVLKGLSAEDLLRIRRAESEHFEAFRKCLRRAIRGSSS
jgi:hypothetical protein